MTKGTFHVSGQSQHKRLTSNDCRNDFASVQVKINIKIEINKN